jgi:hypothetical protein
MKTKPKPIIITRIFWDFDFEVINYYKNALFAIKGVFEPADVDDFHHSRPFDWDKMIPKSLLTTSFCPK